MKHPKLIVLSAPSGAGKTTVAHAILKQHQNIIFSISATTRTRRNSEVEGKDYYFLTTEEFLQKIKENSFVEYQKIYDDYYGSLKQEVENALQNGYSVLFDIDVEGALNIKKTYSDDAILIFIAPPNINEITRRLIRRKTEGEEKLRKRLDRIPMEMKQQKKFDYIVMNDDLQKAIHEVTKILINHNITNEHQ